MKLHLLNDRLAHDVAVAIAQATLDILENVIRPEDKLDAYSELYLIAKNGILAYCAQRERIQERLRPLEN